MNNFFSPRALQEAQDIFGLEFDFEEFDQYGDEYEDEEVTEEEYDEVCTQRKEKRPTHNL